MGFLNAEYVSIIWENLANTFVEQRYLYKISLQNNGYKNEFFVGKMT